MTPSTMYELQRSDIVIILGSSDGNGNAARETEFLRDGRAFRHPPETSSATSSFSHTCANRALALAK